MEKLNVIFGTGPLGYWIMQELVQKNEEVKLISKSGNIGYELPVNVTMGTCDATDPEQVFENCKEATVVYHCAMPPYTKWPEQFPPLMKGIVDGVSKAGAKLIFGDNLYMYGPTHGKEITEDLPYAANGHKGKTRALMAEMLLDAHKEGNVQVSIGRGSDFFGPHVINAAFGQMFFKPAFENKPVNLLGNIDQPHSLTYIQDFAKALIILAEEEKALGKAWHVPSAKAIPVSNVVQIIEQEMGKSIKKRVAGKFLISLLGLFDPMVREVKEMLYTWEDPYVVDSSKFENEFGLKATPLEASLKETIAWFSAYLSKMK
jgi:nucleoside-diphosphate-sugar epimerase